jgi:hypothetical protein
MLMRKFDLVAFVLIMITTILSANSDRALYIQKYSSENKVALVIGNAKYQYFSKLKNSKNDAYDMQEVLKEQGFEVLYLKDGNLKDMKKIVRKFTKKLRNGGVGFFFYAGHGLEVDGQNYLIPVSANIPEKDEVAYESLPMNMIIDKMENSGNRLNIVVLDACRNDPFSRSGGGGLAQINNAKGMYISYATAPGSVASDGKGRNGLFTKHLIKNIRKLNLKLNDVFAKTRQGVYAESNDRQLPWTSSSVIGDFYFKVDSNTIRTEQKRKSYPNKESSFNFNNVAPTTFALKIDTIPSDAHIQITNIDESYYDGIKLKKGSYTIKVSKVGYITKEGNIDLQSSLSIPIKLDKEAASFTLNSNITDRYGNIYKIVKSPYTSRIWLDRNLGAKRVCQHANDSQCFGGYFQWGRPNNGHENPSSMITSTIATKDKPNHDKFIKNNGSWSGNTSNSTNWLSYKNNSLWDGISAKNNPCPKGFRVPNIDELIRETVNVGIKNNSEAFNSFLKLPSSGWRYRKNGKIKDTGTEGNLWSSNADGTANFLIFSSNNVKKDYNPKSSGLGVRCIKN